MMSWSKFRTYHPLCFDISLFKFTIVCPNKKLCLRDCNPCFPLGIIQHFFWDSQFLLTRSDRPFSCHSYEKGSYSRRLPALQYFISAAKCHPAQSIVRKYGGLESTTMDCKSIAWFPDWKSESRLKPIENYRLEVCDWWLKVIHHQR